MGCVRDWEAPPEPRRRRPVAVLAGVAVLAAVGVAVAASREPPPALTVEEGEGLPGAPASSAPLDGWRRLPPAPLLPRAGHVAVWTGSEMIVWGGGGPVPALGADAAAGGLGGGCEQDPRSPACELGLLADGAAYDPAEQRWRRLAPSPLAGRSRAVAAWTGDQMIVWGGIGTDQAAIHDGAAYDPTTDTWAPLPPYPGSPARGSVATWTGRELLVWGGAVEGTGTADAEIIGGGAAYDPARDAWRTIARAPDGFRPPLAAIATLDDSVLVWGGRSAAVYVPDGDVWRGPVEAPLVSTGPMTATRVGGDVVVWGRYAGDASSLAWSGRESAWRVVPPAPITPRHGHVAVAVDGQLVVWGGHDDAPRADGAVLSVATGAWTPMRPAPLVPRVDATAVVTGREVLIWGGRDGQQPYPDGAVAQIPR